MPGTDYRDSQADLMRAKRDSARIVIVPPCDDRERRTRLEANDIEWLMWYFAPESGCESPFTYDFTVQQRSMIAAIGNAIQIGGDQAIAASRGEGKTIICERLLLKYTLQGKVRFSVLFAATGGAAEDSLDSIKIEVETNDRLLADYPEVCVPVRELENTPNRAHYQKVNGLRHDDPTRAFEAASSKFSWCGQEIVFPKVPGSPSAGAIIATRGLDSAVRGVKKKGRRVDVAVIDDPDTEETARSEDQAKKLEDRIDRAIAGLGSQKRRVARVMLTTLQNRICVSYKFTDPTQKPSWNGKRFKFLVTPPARSDLWDEYIVLRAADWQNGTTLAHEFYVANREAMDEGAVVSNPNRYAQGELSALQFYYDEVARIGREAVASEYDNDPPEESGPIESGLTAQRIQKQLSGFPRNIVPADCKVVVQAIDCGKVLLHWVVRAFRDDATGYTIDYGINPVHGTTVGSEEGLELALVQAIKQRFVELEENPYMRPDGEIVPVQLTLVDAHYCRSAIYQVCREIGRGVMPAMGFGKSAGCIQANFSLDQKPAKGKYIGDRWKLIEIEEPEWAGLWRVDMDTDAWKAWEHERWLTDPKRPGCMLLFGDSDGESIPRDKHMSYGQQIVSELEVEEIYKGALRRRFDVKHKKNHWLDASYMADVAASIKGIRLLRQQVAAKKKPPQQEAPPVDNPYSTDDMPYLASLRG